MQEELIQEFREGNKQAGDDYYNVNRGLVYTVSKKYTRFNIEEEEIMAIVNQAFAHAMKNVDLKKAKFSTYFGAVAHGMILRHCRDYQQTIRTQRRDIKSKKIVFCASIDEVIHASDTENITIAHTLGTEDDFTEVLVEEALNKLNIKDRQAFKLKLLLGLSQIEIGEICGCGQVEISRRIARAKATLKIILKKAS